MKILYQDYGPVGQVVISSTVMEFRKHNRVVDAVLLTSCNATRYAFFIHALLPYNFVFIINTPARLADIPAITGLDNWKDI